ncbi:MAG: glycosyltransferase family 2 protein [Bradyrhizobium sp.]
MEATDGSSIAELAPLLTVIYPVFDVRSDAAECIRRWAEQQNVAADRYRVIVAAGAVNEEEKRQLGKALRPQDSLVLLAGKGRDADYWNAGARAATTPWLLFVEAHAIPESGSVAALTEWIAAHPQAVAVNFKISNFQEHLMAGLMKRWFAQIHSIWSLPSTWPRLHRAAFCIRQDAFRKTGPLEPQYGQFAPALLSARMHEQRLAISTLPEATVSHEDSPYMLAHHDDTVDYARGELDARADNEPAFFEKYFGPSPHHESTALLPARCARCMIAALFSASSRQPRRALSNMAKAIALLPAALVGLRERSRILDILTRVDEYAMMQLPLGAKMRWWRFIAAHRRVVRAEQMRWIQRNSRPVSTRFLEEAKPVDILDPMTIIGLHGLEYSDGDPFRWTYPLFVVRLESPCASGLLILETRNLGRQTQRSDISVAIASKAVPQEDISVDRAGNVGLRIRKSAEAREVVVAIAMQEIAEPGTDTAPGRRLGLPLFSVRFAPDQVVPA